MNHLRQRQSGKTRSRLDAMMPGRPVRLACALGLIGIGWAVGGCNAIQRIRADHRIHRGEVKLHEDDLEAALAEFQAAAELDPTLAVAHSQMGIIYRRMGDYELAIDCFIDAITRNPYSFDDTLNLAQLYHYTKRITDAIQAYLHAVELKPNDFDAQLNLGVCYQETGDTNQAIQRFQNAIEIDPDRPYAYVNLGVAFSADEKYYEAIRAYKAALERDNHQPIVLVNLAHTYMKQDRLKIGRQALLQAIHMDPELGAGHEALGYCHFRMKDYLVAEKNYKTALIFEPRLPRAHAGLGSINMLKFLGDETRTDLCERAIEHWHRSLELEPDQPRIHRLIARYKKRLSGPQSAVLNEQAGG